MTQDKPILDVGCGSGVLAMRLCETGFTNVVGTDYSSNAITLANAVKEAAVAERATFVTCDILDDLSPVTKLHPKYAAVLDKGTYDAICLTPNASVAELRTKYANAISNLLADEGYFVLTSCNWTKEELLSHFEHAFKYSGEIATETFQFGGRSGQNTTCVILTKRDE